MLDAKPVVYILRGDDREAIESHIHAFRKSLGAPDMADMNTTHLEGKYININDLRAAALALPFLTERRLVVLEDALSLFEKKGDQAFHEEILTFLDSLPHSTALVLVISDFQKNRKRDGRWEAYWATLGKRHWLMRWAEEAGSRVFIQDCALPTDREMANWIRNKSAELGGGFTPLASQTLADFIGNNTQRAAQEIVKLLTYVNYERPVDDDDVQRLSIQEKQSDIFDMVDAIGNRDGKRAMELLHLLLEEIAFGQLFAMIIRQFRLILQAREIIDDGGNEGDIAKQLGQMPFVARKIAAQAQHFDLPALEAIYQHLLIIDLDTKTGGMDGEVALDIFITRLAQVSI